MRYWTEVCPNCGFKTRCSDMNNSKEGFGTPIVVCTNCKNTYIHPDRIELGMIPQKSLRFYKFKMIFKTLFYLAFFCCAVTALMFSILNGADVLFLVAVALISIIYITIGIAFIKRFAINFNNELELSNQRLSETGYRERLVQSKYTVKYL